MLNKAAYLFGFLVKQSSVHEEMVSSEQTYTPPITDTGYTLSN
jgi:hypothetical protein